MLQLIAIVSFVYVTAIMVLMKYNIWQLIERKGWDCHVCRSAEFAGAAGVVLMCFGSIEWYECIVLPLAVPTPVALIITKILQ